MSEDEKFVKDVLSAMGYRCVPFSNGEARQGQMTPDFRVYDGDVLAFFCEVKTFTDPSFFNARCEAAQPGEVIEELQMGGAKGNRLESQIRKAVKQFRSVNPEHLVPNVAVIVNRDEMFVCDDIRELVEGCFVTPRCRKAHTISKSARNRYKCISDIVDVYLVFSRIKWTGESCNRIYYLDDSASAMADVQNLIRRYGQWNKLLE